MNRFCSTIFIFRGEYEIFIILWILYRTMNLIFGYFSSAKFEIKCCSSSTYFSFRIFNEWQFVNIPFFGYEVSSKVFCHFHSIVVLDWKKWMFGMKEMGKNSYFNKAFSRELLIQIRFIFGKLFSKWLIMKKNFFVKFVGINFSKNDNRKGWDLLWGTCRTVKFNLEGIFCEIKKQIMELKHP